MPSTDADPLLGQLILGRYHVLSKLGEGGMGAVYLAEQVSVHRRVALKMLHPMFARDDQFVGRFRQEARLVASLSNRFVQTVYDFDQAENGSLFMVMEYLEGRTLGDVIRADGALDIARVVRLGTQICEGLAAAHRANVIHRDIKPSNVMVVGEPEEARLLDFGIARLRDAGDTRLTQVSTLMGTPDYMAPEQIEGHEVTEQTDIYALGVMLYQMLTGSVPFRAPTPGAVLAKHLHQRPEPLRRQRGEVPEGVEAVVIQALEKDPDRRPRSVLEIAGALAGTAPRTGTTRYLPAERDSVASSDATIVAPDGPVTRPRRRIPRRVAMGAALLVGIGTGIGVTWWLVRARVPVETAAVSAPPRPVADTPRENTVNAPPPQAEQPPAPPAPSAEVERLPAGPAPAPVDPPTARPPASPSPVTPGASGRERPERSPAPRPQTRPSAPARVEPPPGPPPVASVGRPPRPVAEPSGTPERSTVAVPPRSEPPRPAETAGPPASAAVSPPPARPPVDSASMAQDVVRALRARGFGNVKVEVADGVAVLTGSVVGGERGRQEAIETARRVSGVRDVRASLFVWDAPASGSR